MRDFRVLVTTKDQILDEFDESESVQENIRDFISFTGTYWQEPKPKYFLFAGSVAKIPNFEFESITNYNETDTSASDYFYGINKLGEDTSNVSFYIGRVSARENTELHNYFSKVIKYEGDLKINSWNNNVLYLADDGEPNTHSDIFEQMVFSISESLPENITYKFIFEYDLSSYFGTTDSILTYINEEGVSSLLFSGFGNNEQFTHEGFFAMNKVTELHNVDKPFFAGFLFKQRFSSENITSMLDQFLFSQNASLGGVASVGLNYATPIKNLLTEMWPKMYTDMSLGRAFVEAINEGVSDSEKKKYNFFGDPSIYLKFDVIAGFDDSQVPIPSNVILHQNYPNPFNPITKITFEIPEPGNVKLQIFDVLGREIGEIINEEFNSGTFHVSFNGGSLASGVYYYRLSYNQHVETRKMLLLR